MTTDLIVKALKNGYVSQKTKGGMIVLTALKSQYTSQEFKDLTLYFNIYHLVF